jgi:2,4-dienoyl-CoA reductase-like NADH-dependent reductase (Old Yellow Enzyme family)
MAYDAVFQPLVINGATISNRIVRTAHGTGLRGDDLIAYHVERARGGVGLSILEVAGVHATSASGIPVHSDAVLPLYERLAAALHPHGMQVFQQLWHAGAAYGRSAGMPLWSASDVPNPSVGVIPTPMTKDDIDEVVAAYGAAARRVRDGGLDGVEVHGAHGYLVGQFLSPATNHRTDEYGGSPENRLRFLREVLAAIRDAVGPDFPVGVRLSADEEIEGGLQPVDTADIARTIEPLVDFVDVSLASYWRFHKLLSTLDDPLGYELATSEIVTKAVSVPTIVTGRIMTLDHAAHLITSGVADMVSMVRALVADPYLVAKVRDGRDAQVRPCIGTSVGCVAGLMATGRLQCVVNVAAGNEATVAFETPAPADTVKRVVIVGAGPAGLEAARTAALRGHHVQLFDMARQLGGQVTIAAAAPYRTDLGAITRWLGEEVARLGVEVHLSTPVDPDTVLDARPDVVVLATGTTPRRDGFQISAPATPVPGADLAHVYTSWDVLGFGGRAVVGRTAVVYDDTGTFEAVCIADALIAAGATVTFLSRFEQLGAMIPYPPATVEASRERLMAGPFTFVPAMSLVCISATAVDARLSGTAQVRSYDADTVVIVGFPSPNRELAEHLRQPLAERGIPMHLVGDATGTNGILEAVRQAAGVARAL